MRLPSILPAAVCGGFLTFAPTDAPAQQYGLRNSFRIDNSHSGAGSQVNIWTGWQLQTPGPLVSEGRNAHTVGGCKSQGSCRVSSDYGILHVTGSGRGTNCANSGVGLLLDQSPQAQFFDTLSIVSTSLPQGAPVQLVVGVVLEGDATVADSAPYRDFRAEFAVNTVTPYVANGSGSASATLTTSVGGQMQAAGNIYVTLNAAGLASLGIPPQSAAFDCDLVAYFSVTCMTPGAALQWASGGTYGLVPATVAPAGGGCGATSPLLSATAPVLGQTQNWSVAGATANQPAIFVISLGPPASATFGPCVVRVDLANAVNPFAGVTDATGACAFGLPIPVDPAFAGVRMTGQTLVMSPNGPLLGQAQLTNALFVRLGI